MAKCNDKLESHSAKEKFPHTDKLSATNSTLWSPPGLHEAVESENHPTHANPIGPKHITLERPCALHLRACWLMLLVAKALGLAVYNGGFPQTMRQ